MKHLYKLTEAELKEAVTAYVRTRVGMALNVKYVVFNSANHGSFYMGGGGSSETTAEVELVEGDEIYPDGKVIVDGAHWGTVELPRKKDAPAARSLMDMLVGVMYKNPSPDPFGYPYPFYTSSYNPPAKTEPIKPDPKTTEAPPPEKKKTRKKKVTDDEST